MKPEIKKRWVDALRSGKYQQGRDYLSFQGCYCCLGVLCDLAVKEGVCEWESRGIDACLHIDGGGVSLPQAVREWAGVPSANPRAIYDDIDLPVSELNDEIGLTFPQLADLIEAQL